MNDSQSLISFVIPCYCSKNTIRSVVNEIIEEVKKHNGYDYEIILVNDFSKDETLKEIVDISQNGQMPIESVFDLIEKLNEGYDLAFGKFDEIKQAWYRNIGSWINLKMTEVLLGLPKGMRMSSFWAGKKYIIDETIRYDGAFPYIGGLLLRVTKNMIAIPVKHRQRQYGKSGYTFAKLIALWMNGFTAFSVIPLRIATYSGILCAIAGFILGIVVIIKKILNPAMVMGYASTITVMLFIGGMIMMLLGIIGEYVGRTYISINKAPQYVVKQKWD